MTTKKARLPIVGNIAGGPSAAGFHAIEDYFLCPKRFQFRKVRGIRLKRAGFLDEALAVGTLAHVGRARWFADGFTGDSWRAEMVRAIDRMNGERHVAAVALPKATELMEAYVRFWALRPRPRVLAVEIEVGPFEVEPTLRRTARLDDLSVYNGALWVGDLKTTSDLRRTVEGYGMSPQFTLYTLAGQSLAGTDSRLGRLVDAYGPIRGVMLDAAKKPYTDARGRVEAAAFERHPIPFPPYMIRWARRVLARAITECETMTTKTDAPRLGLGYSCRFPFGRTLVVCPYEELCKYGKSAAGAYVYEDGSPLRAKRGERTPWA